MCSTYGSREILQNLAYFIRKNQRWLFSIFHLLLLYYFIFPSHLIIGKKTDFGKTDWKKLTYRSPRFRTPQGKWTDCPVTAVRFLPSCSKKGWYSLKTDSLLRKCSNWPEKKWRCVDIFLWGKKCKIGLEQNYYWVKKIGPLQRNFEKYYWFSYFFHLFDSHAYEL